MSDYQDAAHSERYLNSFLVIYELTGEHDSWSDFWKKFFDRRLPIQNSDFNKFVSFHRELIASSLNKLGKENPLVQQFLTRIPLRYSKSVLTWPVTSERIQDLTSD